MEKKFYNSFMLKEFNANFEKAKKHLMEIHDECMESSHFDAVLKAKLFQACDYKSLYRYIPYNDIDLDELCELMNVCAEDMVKEFIIEYISKCCSRSLWVCCSQINDYIENRRHYLSKWLKNDYGYTFVNLHELEIKNEIERLKISWDIDDEKVLKWIKDDVGYDVMDNFIWTNYMDGNPSEVLEDEFDEYIDYALLFEDEKQQVIKWFNNPEVQKDYLLTGGYIGDYVIEHRKDWIKK